MRSFAVATGLGLGPRRATLGNKGGVGIAFDVGSTTCIFVNAHLAAHQNNVSERNQHFTQIQHGLVRALAPEVSMRHEARVSPPPVETPGGGGSPRARQCADVLGGDTTESRPAVGQRDDGTQVRDAGALGDTVFDPAADTEPSSTAASGDASGTCPSQGWTGPLGPPALERRPIGSENTRPDPRVTGSNRGLEPGPGTGLPSPSGGSGHRRRRPGDAQQRGRGATLPEAFDRVVWAGDLNYRVNVSRRVADQLLAMGMHEVLVNNEQLTLERAGSGRSCTLAGYQEGPLNFRPTYKFDSGTDAYDTSPKQRVPAWTDRVLYAGGTGGGAGAGGGFDLRAYRSVMELRTSDHRPVLASFVMRFEPRGGGRREEAVTNQTSSEVCSVM